MTIAGENKLACFSRVFFKILFRIQLLISKFSQGGTESHGYNTIGLEITI